MCVCVCVCVCVEYDHMCVHVSFQGTEERRVKILSTVKAGHDIRYFTSLFLTSRMIDIHAGQWDLI